jgi:hypothetical protein
MDFSLKQTESVDFNLNVEGGEFLVPDRRNINEDAKLFSHVTGAPLEEMVNNLSSGLGPKIDMDLSAQVKNEEEAAVVEQLDSKLTDRSDVEGVQSLIDNSIFGSTITSPAEALLAGKTQFAREERRALRRSVMITKLANEYLQSQNTGTTDTLLEIGDQVLSQGVGELFFNFSGERNDLAKEFSSLLFSDKSDDEVIEQAREIFDEMGDQGFFTEENSLYLGAFINQLKEGGVGAAALEDTLLGVVDAASLGAESAVTVGAVALTRAVKAGSTAQRVHKLSDSAAAVEMAVRSLKDGVDPAKAIEEGTAPLLRTGVKDSGDKAPMNLEVAESVEGSNQLLNFVREDAQFIGVLTDEEVAELAPVIEAQFQRNMNIGDRKRLVHMEVEPDGFNNRTVYGYLGRAKGGLFKPGSKAAKDLAERLGGEVVPGQLKDGVVGDVVKVGRSLKQNDLVPATPLSEINDGLFHSLKSTTSRTAVKLDSLLKTNEAQVSRIYKEAETIYNKSAKSVGRKEVRKVDEVMSELNDNPAHFDRNIPFSDAEFAVEYETKFKKQPTTKVVQYYNDQLKLNDTVWALRADAILKRAVENGEAMYKLDGQWMRAKPSELVESKVYNPTDGKYHAPEDFPRGSILEVADGMTDVDGKPVRYVYNKDQARRPLIHNDVLGYNPGGSRIYDGAKFFVKQETKKTFGDGAEIRGTPRTFMATVTEKEARETVKQMNAIVAFIRSRLGDSTFEEVIDAAPALLEDPDFIRVVEANSGWNTGMEPQDLFSFAEEWDLNLSKNVDFAPDGEELLNSRVGYGNTVGENYLVNTSGSRAQKPLVGYGGDPAAMLSPSRATEQSFTVALNKAANDAYIRRAAAGWLKAAKDGGFISNLHDLNGSLLENLDKAKISTTLEGGSKLAAEKDLIQSKLRYKTRDMMALDRTMNKLADFVYNKGAKKISKGLRDTDPVGFLRSLAFNTKLGLFAVDQVMVQSSQLINIMGVSNNGLAATVAVGPIRAAMVAPNNAVINKIAQGVGKAVGIEPEDFINIVRFIKTSGRDLVDQNIIELDGNQSIYNSGMKPLLKAGRIPFNEGELLARIGGMAAAFLDTKAKFPDLDLFSDEGRLLVMRRQDILTASMTSASGAAWQRSMLAVPTQFMTYSVRMWEQMLSSDVLTGPERIRLALTQAAFWGGAGIVPLGFLTDKRTYHGHSGIDPEVYKFARYGMIDYLLSSVYDTETDISSRLGASGGITSMFSDVMEGTTAELLIGPSGEILGESVDLIFKTALAMFSGRWDYAEYDFKRLTKTITSLNRVQSAYMAYSYQQMVSRRSGKVLLENLTSDDALMIGLGIPLKEVTLGFEIYKNSVDHKEYIKKVSEQMYTYRKIMLDHLDNGDLKSADIVSQDIAALYNVLMPYDRNEVKRVLSRPDGDFFDAMLVREVERGNVNSTMIQVARSLKE